MSITLLFRLLLGLLLLASVRVTSRPSGPSISRDFIGYKNVAYFPNWDIYARNYQPQDLPVSQLTHVIYCFCDIASDGSVELSDPYSDLQKHYANDSWDEPGNNVYGNVKQLYLLKKKNRNLKTLLSVGGWTYSANFATPLSTSAGRARFVATSVTFLRDLGFDGIDIDWEYPADADQASAFVCLLQELRGALDAYTAKYGGGRMLITVASPANPSKYNLLQLSRMAEIVDFFNLVAYDYAGESFPDDAISAHMANIYPSENSGITPFSTDKAVSDYIAAGVSSHQIVMGIPLYGRSFDNTAGLGQSYSGTDRGSWQDNVWDFKMLPLSGAIEQIDSQAGASYSYDAETKMLVSYDNLPIAYAKVAYIVSRGLGGGMWWEVSGDRNDSQSLINAAFSHFSLASGGIEQAQNTLDYPNSQYANIAAGMLKDE